MSRPVVTPTSIENAPRQIPMPPDTSKAIGVVVGGGCVVGGTIITCPISVPVMACVVVGGIVVCAIVSAAEVLAAQQRCRDQKRACDLAADGMLKHWVEWKRANPDWETSGKPYKDANGVIWAVDKNSDKNWNNKWAAELLKCITEQAACLAKLGPSPSESARDGFGNRGPAPAGQPRW